MSGVIRRGTPGDVIGDTPSGITGNVIGATPSGIAGDGVEATPSGVTPPTTKEHIKGHMSALRLLVKEHNNSCNISLIHLNFNDVEDRARVRTVATGKEVVDADLKKPFKEAVKTPLTRRIIEFVGPEFKMPANVKLYDGTADPKDHLSRFSSAANSGEWPMPVWCRMFQQTLDGSARGWFENLSTGSIDGWAELKQQFTTRFSTRRACFKDPTEIIKIIRKANESLVAFKERWIVETGFGVGVPEVMKISSSWTPTGNVGDKSGVKLRMLHFRLLLKVPELLVSVALLSVRSEEAFTSTEFPKGETTEYQARIKVIALRGRSGSRGGIQTWTGGKDEMMVRLDDFMRSEGAFASTELPKGENNIVPGPTSKMEDRFYRGGYGLDRRMNDERHAFNNRDGLALYRPQIPYQAPRGDHQATQHPRLTLNSLTKQPKEILASEPQLNLQPPRPMQLSPKKENQDKYCDYHEEKGHYTNNCFQLRRQLEMALESRKLNHLVKDVRQIGQGNAKGRDAKKDKVINMIRSWLEDRKRKSIEGDESWMKAPIVFPPVSSEDASDEPFIIEAVMKGYPVGRVYVDQGASVEVMFEHYFENLSPAMKSRLRSTQMDLVGFAGGVKNWVEDPASSLFNNTFHGKIPHPRGIATLVTRTMIISECPRLEKEQMVEREAHQSMFSNEGAQGSVDLIKETLVNPSCPDQLVTIGGNLFEGCKKQVRALLKRNLDVFAWEPADMTGIPRRIIEHILNVNPLVEPIA
ncbi:hypothetical protein Tco_0811632 [Tanacetum coccineum]